MSDGLALQNTECADRPRPDLSPDTFLVPDSLSKMSD